MADYSTTAVVKSTMHGTTATDDAIIAEKLTTASRAIDAHCHRYFSQDATVSARVFYPGDGCLCEVDDISTATGLIVATDTSDVGTFDETWVAADYQLEPLNGMRYGLTGWPYTTLRAVQTLRWPYGRRPSVQVTARWGWAAIPSPVVTACILLTIELYKRKDAPFGVASMSEFGAIRISSDVAAGVKSLLEPYVRYLPPLA